jgi:predicted Fe-Mo cluster-binding NifX family protein
MKVAISTSGRDLDAPINPRFGRCALFIVVDTGDMTFEVFDNENIALGGGAGIQAAQFLASKGAQGVITGNVGPNAVRTLSAAGIDVIAGQTGTVKQAIDDYRKGKLNSASEENVSDYYGMGGGAGLGSGMGRGAGMGRGMGRGAGMGRGMGRGMRRATGVRGPGNISQPVAPSSPSSDSSTKEQ